MRRGISRSDHLIDLTGIAELTGIRLADSGVSIGAGVTLAVLAEDPTIAARYPALAQAAAAIAAPSQRHAGTVGGNLCLDTRCIYYNQSEWWRKANDYCFKNRGEICHVAPLGKRCHAAFSGDLAPALIALGANLDIVGPQGRRLIALTDLYIEDGKNHLALAQGDLITRIDLPPDPPLSRYAKVRVRGAIDYPLAGVAVALTVADRKLSSLRIALTGTNSRPFLLAGTEPLIGRPVDERALAEIDSLVQKQVQPMRTTLTAGNYRRAAATALAQRLTAELFAAAGG